MRLKFRATPALPLYSSSETGDVRDGQAVEVPAETGARLLRDFPDSFREVGEDTEHSAVEPPVTTSKRVARRPARRR